MTQTIQQQAAESYQEAQASFNEASQQVNEEAQKASQSTRESARRASVSIFSSYGPPLEDLRTQIELEKRRQFLPNYGPGILPILRGQREELKSQRRSGRASVGKQERSILSEIEGSRKRAQEDLSSQLASINTEISEWKRGAEAEEAKFEAENVQLDNGEWVPKSDYNALSTESKAKLKELGIEGFNSYVEGQRAEYDKFVAENVEVTIQGEDQWVPKEEWDKLTPTQQQEVKTTGQYTVEAPSATTQIYEITKSDGSTIEVPQSEWDSKSDFQKLITYLGRTPTEEEYRQYIVKEETGLESGPLVNWISQRLNPVSKLTTEGTWETPQPSWWQGLYIGPAKWVEESFGGLAGAGLAKVIPGNDIFQKWVTSEAQAQREWFQGMKEANIPVNSLGAATSTYLELTGVPALREGIPNTGYPAVTKSEVYQTMLSGALLTTPIWVPKAVQGVKWVGTKVGSLENAFTRFTSRLGTWPFSEKPGLRRAPISTKAPTPKIVKESPFTRQGYEIFKTSLEKPKPISTKAPTPDIFENVKFPIKRPLRGLPERTYPNPNRPKAPYISPEEWERMWKPSKFAPAKVTPVEVPIKTTEWLKPRVQNTFPPPGWEISPAGRYMPAGASPIYIPDIPMLINIAVPGLTPRYIVKKVPTSQVIQTTRLIEAPVMQGTKILKGISNLESQTLTRIRSMTRLRPLTTALTETDTLTRIRQMTSTKTLPLQSTQVLTESQTLRDIRQMNELVPSSHTALENRTLTRLRSTNQNQLMTNTRLQNQLMTNTSPAVKMATETLTEALTSRTGRSTIRTGESIKERGRRIRFPRIGSHPGEEKELPPGTDIWQQGFIEKIVPPPYSGIKPFSRYNPVPKGEGRPSDTFRIVGGVQAIEGDMDLGVVDIKFDKAIGFEGGGLSTDVGRRDPSPTKGMTIRRKKGKEGQFVRVR